MKTKHVRIADHLQVIKNERDGVDTPCIVVLPDGTAADGSGATVLKAGQTLEVHSNEFVRAMLARGELVEVARPAAAPMKEAAHTRAPKEG